MTSGAAQAPDRPRRARRARAGEPQVYHLGYEEAPGRERPFVQKGLSFFEKNEFISLVSEAIEGALDRGLSINEIAKEIRPGGFSRDDLEGLLRGEEQEEKEDDGEGRGRLFDVITKTVLHLVSAAPRLLEDTYLLALGVEPELRSRVRPFLRQIDDETGFKILETFVAQNSKTLGDFFGRWAKTIETAMGLISQSESAAPSAS